MDNILLTISKTFFCRRFKETGISVIIQYIEELDDIIKEYPNLIETNRYNLINSSIQIDFELVK